MKRYAIAGLLALLPTVVDAFELRIVTNGLGSDLRDNSLLTPLAGPASNATAQDIIAAAQADYVRLVGLMYDRGFFAPKVSILIDGREAASLSPVQPPRQIANVEVRVDTGIPFRFGTARLTPLANGTELPEGFTTGQPASTRILQAAVDSGITGWRNQGHAKASLSSQTITARHNTAKLDADIKLSPGPQLRFGNLRISGTTRMREDRVVDIAGLPTGKVFDPEEVERAAIRLRRTGVFSVVSLAEAEDISAGNTLDIVTQLTETKPRRFGFGAELSTQEGLGLSAFWLHRNLFGGAERLRIGGEIDGIGGDTGGEDYTLTLAFGRPATFNEDTDFYLDAEISSLNEPNYSSDNASVEAGIRRYASEKREYTFGLGFEGAKTTDAFGTRSYRILTLPASAEFDYRDNTLDAKDGYYAKASLTPFLNLKGTANGLRGYLDTRAYRTVGDAERVTFALRGQLGFVSGPSLADAPADFLFYSGGGGTVRGQDYQSLGVDLGGGATVGGRSFLGLSGEVRVKTTDKLSVVGFYDVGYTGREEFPDGSTGRWHSGAGLGVRYNTGIGPVRLDLGVPVSGPDKSSGLNVYIGIGQAF